MSGGGTGQGALYSPLPQTISDTDSSEEELINVVHHNDSRKFVVSGKEAVDKRNGQKMGDYRPLDHETEQDVAINGFPARQHVADTVPIIKTEGTLPRHLEPMSPLRKALFIFSILLCGFTIVVFLWVIPCDWGTCPSAPMKTGTKAWEHTLDIELIGRISVVSGVKGRGHNLVFLMRDIIPALEEISKPARKGVEKLPPNGGGILSLVGSTGQVAWWDSFYGLPRDIDCSLVDFSGDNINDCIAVGDNKLLVTVDSVLGTVIWHLRNNSNELNVVDIDFPLILPDIDGDNVNELVSACRIGENSTDRNNLILISGKTGLIIGQPVKIKNCSSISKLSLESVLLSISYECKLRAEKASFSQLTWQELYVKSLLNPQDSSVNQLKYNKIPTKQHQVPNSPESSDEKWSSDVGGHRLTIGKSCQKQHCSITANINNEITDSHTAIWNYSAENTHAMIPVPLTLSNKFGGNNLLPSTVHGFVLKFWQLNSDRRSGEDKSSIPTKPLYRSHLKRSVEFDAKSSHKIFQRSAPTSRKPLNMSINQYNETIVIVVFNGTKSSSFNTSQNNIIQLCVHDGLADGHPICQPELNFQEQSMLVTDLDQDGSQELISFYTTFISAHHDSSNEWYLQSKVRVIRLESELLKLYESIGDH